VLGVQLSARLCFASHLYSDSKNGKSAKTLQKNFFHPNLPIGLKKFHYISEISFSLFLLLNFLSLIFLCQNQAMRSIATLF